MFTQEIKEYQTALYEVNKELTKYSAKAIKTIYLIGL